MNSYHKEQIDALTLVRHHLDSLPVSEQQALRAAVADYLLFRGQVDDFLENHFSEICTRTCYQSRISACCSREGIVTFFADVVVNMLASSHADIDKLQTVLSKPNDGFKCVYLAETGCLWRLKPIVCQMYLCDRAKDQVFGNHPKLEAEWKRLEQKRKRFTWPDRPVLFDELEAYFMKAGCRSALMYLHNSPGLLRVKQRAREKNALHRCIKY